MRRVIAAALAGTLALGGVALAADRDLPATSPEGLVLQEKSKLGAVVYVRPGVDFSRYNRVAILECPVSFRKDWQKEQNRDRASPSNRVTAEDMEAIKKGLSEEFLKIFTDELQNKGGYTVVTSAGEDVLVLRPAIIDLDVVAPDTMTTGRSYTLAEEAGAMTLFLELYDSVSSQIVARAIDRETSRGSGRIQWTNRVTNKAEADRVFRRWASALRARLDEVHGKGKS
jgi:hypothetical protein